MIDHSSHTEVDIVENSHTLLLLLLWTLWSPKAAVGPVDQCANVPFQTTMLFVQPSGGNPDMRERCVPWVILDHSSKPGVVENHAVIQQSVASPPIPTEVKRKYGYMVKASCISLCLYEHPQPTLFWKWNKWHDFWSSSSFGDRV